MPNRRHRTLLLTLLSIVALTGVLAAVNTIGGPLPGPLPLFPADNWWNLDISTAPVDSSSTGFISFIGTGRTLHPDFGGDVSTGSTEIYGFPYAVVDGTVTPRTVQFQYASESDGVDHTTQHSIPFYPIPDEAMTQAHWIEGGEPGNIDRRSSSDRHMLIVDRDRRYLYELYNVFYDGTQWHAGSGAFFDLNANGRRPDTWTSADAAGLAILPGLVRYDEVFGTGEIGHAFRVTVRATNGYVYPASHRAGSASGALPMGARLRLKAGRDLSGFTPQMQKIFRAMQRYGLIVADNGSDMYVSGTYDTRWNNDVLNPAFAALKASDFEVVTLGLHPPSATRILGLTGNLAFGNVRVGTTAQATLTIGNSGTAPLTVSGISYPPGFSGGWSGTIAAGGSHSVTVTFAPTAAAGYGGTVTVTADQTGGVNTLAVSGTGTPAPALARVMWRNGANGQNIGWLMNGLTVSSSAFLPAIADTNWAVQGVGDFDGDGHADVVWRNRATGQDLVWLMDGLTVASTAFLPTIADVDWDIAGVGDVNGDGKADVLFRNRVTGQNIGWLMNGLTVASSAFLPTIVDTNWEIEGVADLDGDGHADVVWRNKVSGQNLGWLMSGLAVSNSALLPTIADTNWKIVGVGDVNGDGKADVLLRSNTSGQDIGWLMDGLTVVNSAFLPTIADTNWEIKAIGDVSGDGRADVMLRNGVTGQNIVWLMNGLAVGSAAFLPTIADTNWQIVGPR